MNTSKINHFCSICGLEVSASAEFCATHPNAALDSVWNVGGVIVREGTPPLLPIRYFSADEIATMPCEF